MTNILTGDNLQELLKNPIYLPKQKHDFSFDLTVKQIFQPSSPAFIDFGGSEYQKAELKELGLVKKSPDDKYGWWDLPHGPKLVKFNEVFPANDETLILVYPHERLLQVGVFMIPFVVESSNPYAFFLIGISNVNMKENARVAKAIGWKLA